MSDHPAIACDLSARHSDAFDQHKRVRQTGLGSVIDVHDGPDGYAVRLPTETKMVRQAAAGRKGVKQYVEDSVLPTIRAAQA